MAGGYGKDSDVYVTELEKVLKGKQHLLSWSIFSVREL